MASRRYWCCTSRKRKQQQVRIGDLPNEILVMIFSYCDSIEDLYHASFVAHRWHAIVSSHPVVWKRAACLFFASKKNTPLPDGKEYKEMLVNTIPRLARRNRAQKRRDGTRNKLRIAMMGDALHAGKTAAIRTYRDKMFPATAPEWTMFELEHITIDYNNTTYYADVIDMSGMSAMPFWKNGIAEADVVVLMFSVVHRPSFDNIIQMWASELQDSPAYFDVVLVGNKTDLLTDAATLAELARENEAPISDLEALEVAEKIGAAAYIKMSSKTQENVDELFHTCALLAVESDGRKFKLINPSATTHTPAPTQGKRERIMSWLRKQ